MTTNNEGENADAPRYGMVGDTHVTELLEGVPRTDRAGLKRVEDNHLLGVPAALGVTRLKQGDTPHIVITHAWRALSVRVLEDSHNFCRLLSS